MAYQNSMQFQFYKLEDCPLSSVPACLFSMWNFLFSRRRILTLILLTWNIGWAPNNASKWQMEFNSAFKGLRSFWIATKCNLLSTDVSVKAASAFIAPHQTSWHCLFNTYASTYRVIQEESAILCEMIVCVILSKKVHMNMGPILDGYGVMTAWNLE
jgi:hypothetical protein